MKKTRIKIVFGVLAVFFMLTIYRNDTYDISSQKMSMVYAKQSVQYTYDSLGRVILAKYPDGTDLNPV